MEISKQSALKRQALALYIGANTKSSHLVIECVVIYSLEIK